MPAMHLKGGRRQPQAQSYTGQTQQHQQHQQPPQQYQGYPAPTFQVAPPTPIIVQGLTFWEYFVSFLINGGIVLTMAVVGYFGWNMGLLGIGGIIRQDLYHMGPMWTFNKTYDLNIGLHHLIPFIMSLIEWVLMPYMRRVVRKIGPFKIYWIKRKTSSLLLKPWQVRVWWVVMLLDVGTNYGGVAAFFVAGVTIPLPGFNLVMATTGMALLVQALVVATAFAFAPEPTIRGALKQFGADTGLWVL